MTRTFGLTAMTLATAFLLAGCGSAPDDNADLNTLDSELTQGNATSAAADPALKSALRDQIMVDPALTQQANADTIRPPSQPVTGGVPPEVAAFGAAENDSVRSAPAASGSCPQCAAARQSLTLGALAERQGGRAGQCATNVSYSAAWANRLPKSVPLYPGARVAEAAGADRPGCALRVVSFSTGAPMQRLLDWYYTMTTDTGFSAQHSAEGDQHVLAGTKAGAAFLVTMKSRGDGGTDVDLMADGG